MRSKFSFKKFQLLKGETQSVQVCKICITFRYNKMQFSRVEVHSLGHHMVYPRLSYLSYELKRKMFHSNLTTYKHWNEENILRKFTNESFTYLLQKTLASLAFSLGAVYSLVTYSEHKLLVLIHSWKQHFYTGTSWNYKLLNMAVWWSFMSRRGRARGKEETTVEQPLSDKPPLTRCGET